MTNYSFNFTSTFNTAHIKKNIVKLMFLLFMLNFSSILIAQEDPPPVEEVTVIGQRTDGQMTPEELMFLYNIIQQMLNEAAVLLGDELSSGQIAEVIEYGCADGPGGSDIRIDLAALIYAAWRSTQVAGMGTLGILRWDAKHSGSNYGINWPDGSYGTYHVSASGSSLPVMTEVSCLP